MVFTDTDLIVGGVISLAAMAFAVAAIVRSRKNKKDREEAKKKYNAEQAAKPPLTPEQVEDIKGSFKGDPKVYGSKGRQTATRDIGNYGPDSRRSSISPSKTVQKAAASTKTQKHRDDDFEEQRLRRNLDTAPMDVGLMPSSPLYQSRHDSGSSRCDDTPSHSHRSHSSCSSSSWGGDTGSSSSSSSSDSSSSCSSSSGCD